MKASIHTLGCKVNRAESEYIAQTLKENGFEIASRESDADVFIINSCTVTSTADKKTRQTVRHFKRLYPNSTVVLTGCYPQAFPEKAAALEDADIVLGNNNNGELLRLFNEYLKNKKRIVEIRRHENGEGFAPCSLKSFGGRVRAFVKIEDGCNRFCSYCIIPMSRGRVRSKPLEELKSEAAALAAAGVKEIVLVGINLSAYGSGENTDIADAVRVCADTQGILRVRLGSLEPDHITDEIISKLSQINEFCPQFHISLQSGCDRTLKNMNRHYTAAEYALLCERLRKTFGDCTLTTDVMVGFNDESESEAIRGLAQYTDEIRERFINLAIRYNINIITGSMPLIKEDGLLYNIGYLCRRDGTYEMYEKLHVTPDEMKCWGLNGGKAIRTFETDCAKIGVLICYDVEFPELSRIMAGEGMQILFVPFLTDTQNAYSRVRVCAQARAIENECFVVIAGSVGNLPKVHNMDIQYAQSGVFTPCDFAFPTDGRRAEATPNTEMILISDVDLDLLNELHTYGSVRNLKDRRSDLYEVKMKKVSQE